MYLNSRRFGLQFESFCVGVFALLFLMKLVDEVVDNTDDAQTKPKGKKKRNKDKKKGSPNARASAENGIHAVLQIHERAQAAQHLPHHLEVAGLLEGLLLRVFPAQPWWPYQGMGAECALLKVLPRSCPT